MSNIKNKLIKIAYENPELRGELLPVIMKIANIPDMKHYVEMLDRGEINEAIDAFVADYTKANPGLGLRLHMVAQMAMSLKQKHASKEEVLKWIKGFQFSRLAGEEPVAPVELKNWSIQHIGGPWLEGFDPKNKKVQIPIVNVEKASEPGSFIITKNRFNRFLVKMGDANVNPTAIYIDYALSMVNPPEILQPLLEEFKKHYGDSNTVKTANAGEESEEEIEEPLFSYLGLPSDIGRHMTDNQIVRFWERFKDNPNNAAIFRIGSEFPPVRLGRVTYETGYLQIEKDTESRYHKPVFKITRAGLQPHLMMKV